MFPKPDQQLTSSSKEVKEPEATEKTIPFLRRLVDMLSENEDVISFCPGRIENGSKTLGRIVVHDRIKVENEILTRYFNHSSFASLRRQLNYFSFTRIGKGRQKGATYCNEGVIVIDDILRLRRRSTTSGNSTNGTDGCLSESIKNRHSEKVESHKTKSTPAVFKAKAGTKEVPQKNRTKRSRSVTSLQDTQYTKKARFQLCDRGEDNESTLHIVAPSATPKIVSPVTSPLHSPSTSPDGTLQVSLDLTVPPPQFLSLTTSSITKNSSSSVVSRSNDDFQQIHRNIKPTEDPDIIAGCKALLCFSHGIH